MLGDFKGLRLKYQEDFKDRSWWNTACNCLAVIRAIELEAGTLLSIQETKDIIDDLIALGKLSKHAGLNSTKSYFWLGKYIGRLLRKDITCSQVGFMDDDGKAKPWSGEREPAFTYVQLKHSCINSKGRPINHWTLGNDDGQEIYNSFKGELQDCKLQKRYLLNIEVR